MNNMVDISVIKGKTLKKIEVSEKMDRIDFEADDGTCYYMLHEQDCCESVYIEDICGSIDDLVGSPLLQAEEVVSHETPKDVEFEYQPDSSTWTFYHFATIKGYVTIRWCGESNGYYSESVDFYQIGAPVN